MRFEDIKKFTTNLSTKQQSVGEVKCDQKKRATSLEKKATPSDTKTTPSCEKNG